THSAVANPKSKILTARCKPLGGGAMSFSPPHHRLPSFLSGAILGPVSSVFVVRLHRSLRSVLRLIG
ncbi:hypothetical protein A2U01_0064228, partial [Trifolium medium]|nr:hypothetical protein [Trifolium medium]